MSKVLKYIGFAAASLIGLVIIAFFVLKLISNDQYKAWITSAAQSATGRAFSIGGLAIDLNTSLRIEANDVQLANAEWSDKPSMLSVGRLAAEVDLISLLGGVAEMRAVIEKADVIAETNADGDSNWAFGRAPSADDPDEADVDASSGGLPLRPLVREFRIQDSTVTFAAGVNGKAKTATIEQLLFETPHKESTLSLTGQLADLPIDITGNLGQIDEVLDRGSSPVNLDGRVGQSILKVSGAWGPLLPAADMDLDLNVDIPSTSNLTAIAGLDLADLGALKLKAKLMAVKGRFSIARVLTNMDGDVVAASAKGSIEDLRPLNGIDISVEAGTSTLLELMRKLKVEIPLALPPDIKVSAQIQGGLDAIGVKNFNAVIRDEGVLINVNGTVTNALAQHGVDGTFSIKVDSTAALSKYAKLELPNLGAIDASGRILGGEGKTFSLADLNAVLDGGNVNMRITGGIDDLIKTDGINTDLNLDINSISEQNVADLERLLKQLDVELPLALLPVSAQLTAKFSGGLEKLAVTDIEAEVRDEGVLVTLAGAIANALAREGIDATVTLNSESLSALSKYAGMALPEIGPLNVTGQVLSKGETFRLENLDAKLAAEDFNVALVAAVDDLLAVRGINTKMDASVVSLDALSDLARTELPRTDPVTLHADISSDGEDETRPAAISVRTESAGAVVSVDGKLSDLKSADNLEMLLTVEAESLSDFSKIAQRDLPDKGPFKLTGTVRTQPNEYSLDDLQLNVGDQSLNGSIGIKLAKNDDELSTIKGQLVIPYLDLSPFLLSDADKDPVSDQPEATVAATTGTKVDKEEQELLQEATSDQTKGAVENRLFSTDPLPLGVLRKIDADFSVTADRLKLGKTDVTDFTVALSLQEGLLRVDPIKGLAGPGTIAGNLQFDGRSDAAKLAVDLTLDDIPMPNLGGGLHFNSRLDGDGDSVAAIMGGLDGRIVIVVRDGVIPRSYATNFGSGLLSFSGGKDSTGLECGIVRIEIEDGQADFEDKLAAQLTDVTWLGGGEINLKTEELSVGIVPKPRKGIGIGAGGLASLVHVGGTLKNPRVQLDPKDVALKYGKYMAHVSTGGLSLLAQALLNRSEGNVDVCAKILDGTVFDEDADGEPAAEQEEPAQDGQATRPAGDADARRKEDGAAESVREKQAEQTPAEHAPVKPKEEGKAPTSKAFQ